MRWVFFLWKVLVNFTQHYTTRNCVWCLKTPRWELLMEQDNRWIRATTAKNWFCKATLQGEHHLTHFEQRTNTILKTQKPRRDSSAAVEGKYRNNCSVSKKLFWPSTTHTHRVWSIPVGLSQSRLGVIAFKFWLYDFEIAYFSAIYEMKNANRSFWEPNDFA